MHIFDDGIKMILKFSDKYAVKQFQQHCPCLLQKRHNPLQTSSNFSSPNGLFLKHYLKFIQVSDSIHNLKNSISYCYKLCMKHSDYKEILYQIHHFNLKDSQSKIVWQCFYKIGKCLFDIFKRLFNMLFMPLDKSFFQNVPLNMMSYFIYGKTNPILIFFLFF